MPDAVTGAAPEPTVSAEAVARRIELRRASRLFNDAMPIGRVDPETGRALNLQNFGCRPRGSRRSSHPTLGSRKRGRSLAC